MKGGADKEVENAETVEHMGGQVDYETIEAGNDTTSSAVELVPAETNEGEDIVDSQVADGLSCDDDHELEEAADHKMRPELENADCEVVVDGATSENPNQRFSLVPGSIPTTHTHLSRLNAQNLNPKGQESWHVLLEIPFVLGTQAECFACKPSHC